VSTEQVAELRAGRSLVVDDEHAPQPTGTWSRTTVPKGNERSFTPSP
jgi:hypothetical protein